MHDLEKSKSCQNITISENKLKDLSKHVEMFNIL